MSTHTRSHADARILPDWSAPLALVVGGIAAAVGGGGFISGLLAGHGVVFPTSIRAWVGVVKGVLLHPGDPAQAWAPGPQPGPAVLTWIAIGTLALGYWFAARAVLSWRRRSEQERTMQKRGFAGRGDLRTHQLDAKSAVIKARKEFTSLQSAKVRELDPRTAAVRVGNLRHGHRDDVFIAHRDSYLIEGPTGSGKTWRIVVPGVEEAPGPVLSATTKPDVIAATVASRLSAGHVEVFDPEGISHWPTPMRWSILDGCADPDTAIRRAAALVAAMPMSGTKNSGYWDGKAIVLMRSYLYAAAVSGASLEEVRVWVNSRSVEKVRNILRTDLPSWAGELEQILDSQADSTGDIIGAAARLLAPLASPRLLAAVDVPARESADLSRFVESSSDTLYVLSEGGEASCAPFTSVLAAEVHHLAKKHALSSPQERLDPPLRMVLDEVNNIAPMPGLADKMTDSGGRGISIWACVHSERQNIDRWGPTVGKRLTTESPARLILPGLADDAELTSLSRLLGDREERTSSRPDAATVQRPVLSAAEIRQLDTDCGLLVYRSAKPMLLHLPTVWDVPALKERAIASRAVYDEIARTGQIPGPGRTAPTPVTAGKVRR